MNAAHPVVAGLILAAAAFGCSPPKQAGPLTPDAVVLAFGDSLTQGTGALPEESYTAVLEKLLGRRVINAGLGGEVSAAGLARLPELLDQHRPALVILCHGGNDLLQKRDPAQIEEDLRTMIRLIRARGADVLLVGVPRPGLVLKTAPFYGRLAREFDLPYEGAVLKTILSSGPLKSDAIHPNRAGYRRLAKGLALRIRTR